MNTEKNNVVKEQAKRRGPRLKDPNDRKVAVTAWIKYKNKIAAEKEIRKLEELYA